MQHPLRTMQDEFERAKQYGHSSSSAISTGSSSNSSNTNSGVATPQLTTAGSNSNSNASAPLPMALSAGVSASLASQGYLSSSSSRSNTALQLSPGPFNANFSPSAYELGTSYRNDASPGYLTGNDYSEVLGRKFQYIKRTWRERHRAGILVLTAMTTASLIVFDSYRAAGTLRRPRPCVSRLLTDSTPIQHSPL
jgi:hypothetical protein